MSTEPKTPPPPEYIFREHKSTVNYVHLFDDDQYLASCDADGWVVVWKTKTRRPVYKWKAHKDNCLKVTTIQRHGLISQGRDNMIHIWKLPIDNDENQESVPSNSSSIVYNSLSFCKFACSEHDKASTLLSFPSRDDIELFDIYDLTYQRYVIQNVGKSDSGADRLGSCMALQLVRTSDAVLVLSGYESGSVALWEIKDESKSRLVWHKREHKEPVLDLSIDPTYTFAISSSADNQLCKYSLPTGDVIKKITIKKSGIVALKIRYDNKIFATGGYDGRIRVFSVKTMKPLAVLSYHKDTVYSIDFSSSGNWLVCSSQDHRISLWSIF